MCDICHHTVCDSRCPNAQSPPIIGYCSNCNIELDKQSEIYIDNEDNLFCSKECGVEFHGIKEVDNYELYNL